MPGEYGEVLAIRRKDRTSLIVYIFRTSATFNLWRYPTSGLSFTIFVRVGWWWPGLFGVGWGRDEDEELWVAVGIGFAQLSASELRIWRREPAEEI